MLNIIRKFSAVLIIMAMGAFCFWCGYQVGVYERNWEKTHEFRITIPAERPGLPVEENVTGQRYDIELG